MSNQKESNDKSIILDELWQNPNIPLSTKITRSIEAENYKHLNNKNNFLNLSTDDKLLVVYFTGSSEDLVEILENNFPNLINEHIARYIAYVYKRIKDFKTREFLLKTFQKYPRLFMKINDLREIFGITKNTISFLEKYQDQPIFMEILNASARTLYEYHEELYFLSKHKPLKEITKLSDLKKHSLEDLENLAAQNENNFREIELYSPENYKTINFFKYPLEILVIKKDGEWSEFPVNIENPQHIYALEEAYKDRLYLANLNEFQASCEINNKLGEIVWLIENSGISMFYPQSLTEEELNSSLEVLGRMQNSGLKFELRGGITTNEGYFGLNPFNDGEEITISAAIDYIKAIPIENKPRSTR